VSDASAKILARMSVSSSWNSSLSERARVDGQTMVKDAVQQTKAVTSSNKEHRQTAPAAGTQRSATMSALRDEAANFAKIQQRVKTEEKTYAGQSAFFRTGGARRHKLKFRGSSFPRSILVTSSLTCRTRMLRGSTRGCHEDAT